MDRGICLLLCELWGTEEWSCSIVCKLSPSSSLRELEDGKLYGMLQEKMASRLLQVWSEQAESEDWLLTGKSLLVVVFFSCVFCKQASDHPALSSVSPSAILSLSLTLRHTHTSFAVLLQSQLFVYAYVSLVLAYPLQRELEGQIGFFHNSMAAFWSARHELQILNLNCTWICLVICEGLCLSTGVNRGMKFHSLKSQIFLCCVCVCSFLHRYASIQAIESPSKEDEQQWLSYWVLYSFITLFEVAAAPVLFWYTTYPQKLPPSSSSEALQWDPDPGFQMQTCIKEKQPLGWAHEHFIWQDNEKLAFELSWLVGFSHHLVSW